MQHDNDNSQRETVKVRHVYIFPDYAEEVSNECGSNAEELLEALREAVDECDRAAANADDAQSNAQQAAEDADTASNAAREASDKVSSLERTVEAIAADEKRRGKWMQDAQKEAYDNGFNAGWLAAMDHARRATLAVPEVVK